MSHVVSFEIIKCVAMKHPGLDCKLFVWRLSLLELMTELQGGTGGGLTEFLRLNLLSSPSMESVSAPGT